MLPSTSQLENFTDVFRDDVSQENISQPISLPSSNETIIESPKKILAKNSASTSRPLKGTGQHGDFRSVEEIDPKYRCLFTFPYFNLVQSRVIEDALYSDKSLVLCAPTGSGKTVAFEMAILQLLMEIEDTQYAGDFKIIYMAPVKAVCNERLTEWYPKLTKLGLLCIEVTGDTEVDFAQLKPYKVIITTPEKWDMLTRRWRDHRGLVEMIKLFLIDEVHILNDETRGPVLETVVSRMKTIESAAQSAHRIEQLQRQYHGSEDALSTSPRIRFVAVSATVSNPEDVAHWLGTSDKPAVFYKFGDECRPVRLRQVVEGYPCAEGTSIFKFDIILNYKLWSIIQKYYNGKPTLIFCNTRKSVALTAETLSKEITVSFNPEQKAKLTALASTLKNKKLQMLVMSGVGCHHAGLLYEERVNIERAFRNRDLPILVTTTTLAMGVNLPAHLVIIKNTQQYVNGAYQEYSISTVLQMVGRAGRPQFDTEATAVIMTRLSDKARYQSLVGGSEPLQSYLHKRIAENLNSEAALGTVTDVAQCVEWLRSTFLYVRAAKDPKRYLGLPPAAPTHLILKKIEELCVKAMNSLASSGLITMDEASCIESTEAGRLMSIFYLDVETMKNIMKIDGTENLELLLLLVCKSHELSEMHLRMDERRCLNLLNRNKAAATIRFPMKGKISTREMKMNCIIQACLGCLHIPEPSLNQEAIKVMKIAGRVCTCLVRYVSRPELVSQQPQCFSAVLNSIILAKCIEAHLWENSPYVSKQLKGIGPTFSTLLASAGITSFILLEESHPRDLERIMNKGPPAGNVLRKQVSLLPKYQLTATPIDGKTMSFQLMLLNHCHLSENMDQLTAGDSHKSYLIVGDSENNLLLQTQFTDSALISVYDGTMNFEITRKLNNEHKIMIHCISSKFVGIDAYADFTFLDLIPQPIRESDYFCSPNPNLPTSITRRQTHITDVFKERKRKPGNDIDITQCKEKKKRETNLTQKLKALKESFGKTSKKLRTDIDKSAEASSELLNDLLKNHGQINSSQKLDKIQDTTVGQPDGDLINDFTCIPSQDIMLNEDDYVYINDSEIDNILSNIESEIYKSGRNLNENPTKQNLNCNLNPVPRIDEMVPETKNINTDTKVFKELVGRSQNKNVLQIKDSTKRKNTQTKSNFSFMDVIEKKANSDDTDMEISKSDCGFSEAIKSQISNFLQRTKESKLTSPGVNQSFYNLELPAVHVKRNTTTKTGVHAQNTEQYLKNVADEADTKPENEIPLNKITNSEDGYHELYRNSKDIELPPVYVKKKPVTEISINAHCIQQENPDANNDKNESEYGKQVEIPTVKPIKVQTHIDHNNVEIPSYSVNKSIEKIQNMDKTVTDNNTILQTAKIMMPSHKPAFYEEKIDSLDAGYKSLIPYHRQLEGTQPEIENINAFNLTVPVRPSNREMHQKPVTISSLSMITHITNMTEKYAENKLEQVEILNKYLTPRQLNTNNALLPHDNDSCIFENIPNRNSSEKQVTQLKVPANESLVSYQCEQGNVEYNDDSVHVLNTALPVSDPIINIVSNNVSRSNPSKVNKNPAVNLLKWNTPLCSTSYHCQNPMPLDSPNLGITYSDNSKKTQVNRYCYTSTKIDVCTKNNADHQLRIIRKLKVDVDITESVTQEKININKMNFQKENFDVQNAGRDEVQSLSEHEQKIRLKRKAEDCEPNLDETNTNLVLVESDHPKMNNKNQEDICDIDEEVKYCTSSNNVCSILKKYSKILSKPGIVSTPTITRINKNNDVSFTSCIKTSQPKSNVAKSRRPFRIEDIHTIDVPTQTTVEPSRPAADKQVKAHRECLKPTVITENEVKPPVFKTEAYHNLDVTEQDYFVNERSPIPSPISVLSLELDPIENIKDDNMFNPKALLQYFSTDSKSDTEVIAPPAEFCDASAYSPTMPTQHVTEGHYEYDCNIQEHSIWEDECNLNNNNSVLGNDQFHSSPEQIETWTLSRDDENACYMSQPQPISSVPWVTSQRAGSSQASTGFGSSRTRLGQFKFVRKKPLKPR